MKYYHCLLLSWSIFKCFSVEAQKNDYIWLSGYDSKVLIDSAQYGFEYGNTKLDFNFNPTQVSYDSLSINFGVDNVTTSNNNGNLLFSTNAVYIFNSFNELIENGDSLNPGFLQYGWAVSDQQYGYTFAKGIIGFQDLTDTDRYYLIHSYVDSVGGSGISEFYCPKILMTLVDMSANNAHGNVIFKNQPVVVDNFGFELAAARHGNGRDWWLLIQKRNTNCYYRILIDTNGPHVLADLTCGDSAIYSSTQDYGSATFSPDGSKYVYFTIMKGLKIFDFDRCTGELSNPVQIHMDIWDNSGWLGNGVAISPNSRFLYLSITHYVIQYDLQAPNIFSSADTVGVYDGFALPNGSVFDDEQLAADGKIYISCGNSEADYHVINNPDSLGAACDFKQHSLMLPTLSLGVPNFPNYRLGPLTGSACDTIYTETDEVKIESGERTLKVFPNPATDIVTVDYGFTNWSAPGMVSLEIINELGEVVYVAINGLVQ